MKSKIHRATVTHADLHYVGSLTISRDLMDAANLYPGEKVDVVDINNGARLSTYVIEGPARSGIIGVNGAAARLISPGDLVIVLAYARVPAPDARTFQPRVVFVDQDNRIRGAGTDPADAAHGTGLVRGDDPEVVTTPAAAGRTVWFTGLPSAGKSTLATALAEQLPQPVQVLDGDVLRRDYFPELGFSQRDRAENVHRTGRLAAMLARHGVTVLVSVIAPRESARHWVRQLHTEARLGYLEVWVDAPVKICAERDVKGLYARARKGELSGLTGVDDPYEPPSAPELRLRTDRLSVAECLHQLRQLLRGGSERVARFPAVS